MANLRRDNLPSSFLLGIPPSETYLSRKDIIALTRSLINAALQRLGDNYASGKFVDETHADASPLQAFVRRR